MVSIPIIIFQQNSNDQAKIYDIFSSLDKSPLQDSHF